MAHHSPRFSGLTGGDCRRPHATRAAFTLIEIMVSTSILILIVLLVNQLINSASLITVTATKRIDSDNQARLIFAKMAEDFDAMYQHGDLNYYFLSQNGNDAFYFYSQAPGHIASQDVSGTSDATLNNSSLVGYRVSDKISGGSRVELERLGRGLHWADGADQTGTDGHATSVLHLPWLIKNSFSTALADPCNNSSNPYSNTATTAPQWDVIGDQVFRMKFCFLLNDGSFSLTPILSNTSTTNNLTASGAPGASNDSTAGYTVGSRWYDTNNNIAYTCINAAPGAALWAPLGLGDVKAVVVTLALIDPKSRATTTVAAIQKAISSMHDATTGPQASTWMPQTDDAATFARSSGLSRTAASSIYVYERFFYLQ
jgi:Tfp pilus assembly protein PilV